MDFCFSSEQDDLRREARAFLEANPSPTMDQLARARLGRDPAGRGLHVPRRGGALRGARPRALRRAVCPERGRGPARRRGLVDRGRRLRAAPRPGGARAHARHAGRAGAGRDPRDGRRVARPRQALAERREPAEANGPTCGAACSPRSRSKRSGSAARRRARDRVRVRAASSSARRSAPTRRSRTRSSTRTSRSSSSRSLAYWAAWAVAEDDEQADLAVAAAKSQATEAAVLACEKSIQAHGGIGFTWEHPLHRYYKRALWLEGALGYGREHRAEIAASLLSS